MVLKKIEAVFTRNRASQSWKDSEVRWARESSSALKWDTCSSGNLVTGPSMPALLTSTCSIACSARITDAIDARSSLLDTSPCKLGVCVHKIKHQTINQLAILTNNEQGQGKGGGEGNTYATSWPVDKWGPYSATASSSFCLRRPEM